MLQNRSLLLNISQGFLHQISIPSWVYGSLDSADFGWFVGFLRPCQESSYSSTIVLCSGGSIWPIPVARLYFPHKIDSPRYAKLSVIDHTIYVGGWLTSMSNLNWAGQNLQYLYEFCCWFRKQITNHWVIWTSKCQRKKNK